MKKALFILVAFALIGFAGCKQATSGGGGGGDTNPLIGTWELYFKGTLAPSHDPESEWTEFTDTLTFTTDDVKQTYIVLDVGSGLDQTLKGTRFTLIFTYTIDEENSKVTFKFERVENVVGYDEDSYNPDENGGMTWDEYISGYKIGQTIEYYYKIVDNKIDVKTNPDLLFSDESNVYIKK